MDEARRAVALAVRRRPGFHRLFGSHQDAINKGLKDRAAHPDGTVGGPYLSIDPHDIGRNYRAIIRINSQSGKGGVAYVMEQEFGYVLPKAMHRDFGKIVNRVADERGEELPPEDILELFQKEYLDRDVAAVVRGREKNEARAEWESTASCG